MGGRAKARDDGPSLLWVTGRPRTSPRPARRRGMIGRDVTDFGCGDFSRRGLALFCVRNGRQSDPNGKHCADKLLIVDEEQETPCDRHRVKMEDVINRGSGVLVLEFAHADTGGNVTNTPTVVHVDAVIRQFWSGSILLPASLTSSDSCGQSSRIAGAKETSGVRVATSSPRRSGGLGAPFDQDAPREAQVRLRFRDGFLRPRRLCRHARRPWDSSARFRRNRGSRDVGKHGACGQ